MYYIIYFLLYVISLLPFWLLYGVSDFIAFVLFRLVGYRKKVVFYNLQICFPDYTEKERLRIAVRFYRNLTDTFIETIKLLSISEKKFHQMASIDLTEAIAIANTGRSVQFMAGHQFNWELANWLIAEKMPIPFVGVYMKIKNEPVNKIFYNLRAKKGTVLVAATEFRNKMHQLINCQYSIGLAADQNPGNHSQSNWLYYFGRPTPFISGPDKAAIRNHCAVIFIKMIKLKRGQYRFEAKLLAEKGEALQEGELTIKYRDMLENLIKEGPDNYLWSHRRWKAPYHSQYADRWIDHRPPPMN